LCTAFYSFRLLINTFLSNPRGPRNNYLNAHEPLPAMMIPLIILGFGSIFVGYLFKDLVIGIGTTGLGNSIYVSGEHITLINAEFLSPITKQIPVILSILGALSAIILY